MRNVLINAMPDNENGDVYFERNQGLTQGRLAMAGVETGRKDNGGACGQRFDNCNQEGR